jgi:hypothetical protein
MKRTQSEMTFKALASVLALSTVVSATASMAQSPVAGPDTRPATAPPAGQFAPPPTGAEASGSRYTDQAQQFDRDYAERYSQWAAQNCVDQRNNNTAAGAVIGGVLGAVLGSNAAGHGARGAGAVVGGALGATAGAAIASSASQTAACPPGYVVRTGAPVFTYEKPGYAPEVVYGPDWYQPWVWADGHWVYRPYRYWYWRNDGFWRPDWRAGPWVDHYRRW